VVFPAALDALDQEILRGTLGAPGWAVPLFYVATVIGAGWGLFALVPFLVRKDTRRTTAWCLGAVLATSALTGLLKNVFGRVRPCNALGWCAAIDVGPPAGASFPSGHASGSFAFAAFVAARYPKHAPWVLLYAALVAWSRCVLGVHYPSDVLAGALLGIAIGLAFERYSRAAPLRAPALSRSE
jgi:undecaprenyl-diphosphatase